ncbi:MAG TPA: alpha/beta fold hydrolase [Myxococcota bacterium]|jgi:dienelactone hydrolase|nr:alpha/beta fold hydrolase [Myxococcota bacterium]
MFTLVQTAAVAGCAARPTAPAASLPAKKRLLPPGAPVTLTSKDGMVLHAEWRTPAGRVPPFPALLLLHDLAGDLTQWDEVWPLFEARGWAVLALDLRAHGGSTRRADGARVTLDTIGPVAVAAMPVDVWAALDWLRAWPDADAARLAVVGAGLGANLAWVASGTEWGVQAAVALSPGTRLAKVGEEIADLAPRGVLLVAGERDPGAEATARALAARSAGSHRLLIVRGTSGHGTDLLRGESARVVGPEVTAWIEKRWSAPPGADSDDRP